MVVPREEMESHLKDHCNLLLSCCAFKEAGCRFKVNFSHRTPLTKPLDATNEHFLTGFKRSGHGQTHGRINTTAFNVNVFTSH